MTFGQPRGGDKLFAGDIGHVQRMVYSADTATSLPFASLGYRHGGQRWQISRKGQVCRGGNWRDLSPVALPPGTGWPDHSVDNYVRMLQ